MAETDEKSKGGFFMSLAAALGIGGSGGAGVAWYVQEAQGKSIERLEARQDMIERTMFIEFKELNKDLTAIKAGVARIEGRLEK